MCNDMRLCYRLQRSNLQPLLTSEEWPSAGGVSHGTWHSSWRSLCPCCMRLGGSSERRTGRDSTQIRATLPEKRFSCRFSSCMAYSVHGHLEMSMSGESTLRCCLGQRGTTISLGARSWRRPARHSSPSLVQRAGDRRRRTQPSRCRTCTSTSAHQRLESTTPLDTQCPPPC